VTSLTNLYLRPLAHLENIIATNKRSKENTNMLVINNMYGLEQDLDLDEPRWWNIDIRATH
jgi:hypothetical protein